MKLNFVRPLIPNYARCLNCGREFRTRSVKHPSSCSHCREKCFDDRLIHEIMLRFRQDEL